MAGNQKRKAAAKIGRNNPCHCGSQKKFKKCHGSTASRNSERIINSKEFGWAVQQKLQEHQAKEVQRVEQQGMGRPIVSAELNGHRLMAVGNRLLTSRKWKSFHDFLLEYIKICLGGEWGNAELKKPHEERHPIIQWYHNVCDLQREYMKESGRVYSAPMTGAASAYLRLAYNLYLLAHNANLQEIFIKRLKNPDQFHGAYYEAYVAASFIKAGFEIEFEDESDGASTHCEFTATSKTGKKFSVEQRRGA